MESVSFSIGVDQIERPGEPPTGRSSRVSIKGDRWPIHGMI
jgi:hypothetical protein